MNGEYNPELCDNKHAELERRVGTLEVSWSENLKRLYDKIDDMALGMMKRLPLWVTVVITVLGSACTGLLVALATRR